MTCDKYPGRYTHAGRARWEEDVRFRLFAAFAGMSGGWMEYQNHKTPLIEFCRWADETHGNNIPDSVLAEGLCRFTRGGYTVADLRARLRDASAC